VTDNLEVQQVSIEGRRYVICHNPLEARKDAAARAAIIAKLEATLQKQGQRAVVGNKGFARFMHVTKGAMTINRAAIEVDARYDGTFVLRTNTELPADEVARAYKSLWRVERTFRETKSTLEVRPIFPTVTIRRSATSSAAFSPSVSKWICRAASSSVRSTSRGPT
jgi:hypothetical protein